VHGTTKEGCLAFEAAPSSLSYSYIVGRIFFDSFIAAHTRSYEKTATSVTGCGSRLRSYTVAKPAPNEEMDYSSSDSILLALSGKMIKLRRESFDLHVFQQTTARRVFLPVT
jgi:hypothetical protein